MRLSLLLEIYSADRVSSYSGFEDSCYGYSQCTEYVSTDVLSLGWGLLAVVIDIASSVFLSCSTLNFWSFFNTVLWRRLSLSIFCLSQHIPMHVSLASELGML